MSNSFLGVGQLIRAYLIPKRTPDLYTSIIYLHVTFILQFHETCILQFHETCILQFHEFSSRLSLVLPFYTIPYKAFSIMIQNLINIVLNYLFYITVIGGKNMTKY